MKSNNYATIGSNHDNFQKIKLFILLNKTFSFCDNINKLLKSIYFEIVFTISCNDSHCYFKGANIIIDFNLMNQI